MIVTIYVTTKCNLKCSYCYVDKSSARNMETESIPLICNFINRMADMNNEREVVINFFGGEPLLRIDFIKEFVNTAKNIIMQSVRYSITTNGTLLNHEIVDYLEEKNFELSISIDGTPEIHDMERRFFDNSPSWMVISGNLEYALKKIPNIVGRLTFNSQTCYDLNNSVRYIVDKGFRIINIVPDYFDSRWNEDNFEVLKQQMTEIKKEFKSCSKYNNVLLNIFDEELMMCGDCDGGTKTFTIDVDGNIFPCTYSAEYPKFKIGNVEDFEKYIPVHYHIKDSDRKSCQGCKYFDCCISGRCLFLNYKISGKFYEPNGFFCEYQKLVYSFS